MVVLTKNIVSIPLKTKTDKELIFELFKRMNSNYKVKDILGAVDDIVQPIKKIEVAQKEVNQEVEEVPSSKAEPFEIDEIQKIPPETENIITKAEKSLEINKSQKKDNDDLLILTNLYEAEDKFEKDKTSEILTTQNNLKTENQTTKLNEELSSTKKEEKTSSSISSPTGQWIDKTEQRPETNEPEKKDEPLLLINTQKAEDVLKNKVTNEILETKNDPKTESQITKLDNELSSSKKQITLLKDELKIQSGLVHKQQDKVRGYQESILNLRERISKFEGQENKLYEENAQLKENLKRVSKEIKPQNDVNDKMLEAEKRIKYYQEDNLRLSSELVTLSKRLDNTKHQLVSYESNKQQIMSEIKNLNNVISQSNIINNQFGSTILESDKIIINNDGKITKKVDQKVKSTDDINLLVKEIFKR